MLLHACDATTNTSSGANSKMAGDQIHGAKKINEAAAMNNLNLASEIPGQVILADQQDRSPPKPRWLRKGAVTHVVTIVDATRGKNALRVSRVKLRDLAGRYFNNGNSFVGVVRIMNMQEVSAEAIGTEAQRGFSSGYQFDAPVHPMNHQFSWLR